ncbi:MAG: hypothetical protein HON99_06730 [Crocinitomicaceae bacterium]|jgi:hypothetical protein|nr:hypothetical protein [Crocinitomicaceae bacterium]MBT6514589.1 hypothetical protein [Crocinitomicaceae bacterium]MDG2331266.1 hypothetical protein [Flavobacteriales bacterium]
MFVSEELQNPTIYFGTLRIDEPITALTDILISVVCFYAFYKLKNKQNKTSVRLYFKQFFILMGVSTFLGAFFGHAFSYALSDLWKTPYWCISMIAVAFAERTAINLAASTIHPKYVRYFKWVNILELLVFMIFACYKLNFLYVLVHSAYGILGVTGAFYLYILLRQQRKGSTFFLKGIGFSLVGAAIFLSQLCIGRWFNYMDISHVLMAISAWYFYKGSVFFIDDTKLTV